VSFVLSVGKVGSEFFSIAAIDGDVQTYNASAFSVMHEHLSFWEPGTGKKKDVLVEVKFVNKWRRDKRHEPEYNGENIRSTWNEMGMFPTAENRNAVQDWTEPPSCPEEVFNKV